MCVNVLSVKRDLEHPYTPLMHLHVHVHFDNKRQVSTKETTWHNAGQHRKVLCFGHALGWFRRKNFVTGNVLTTSLGHKSLHVSKIYNLLAIDVYDTKNCVGFWNMSWNPMTVIATEKMLEKQAVYDLCTSRAASTHHKSHTWQSQAIVVLSKSALRTTSRSKYTTTLCSTVNNTVESTVQWLSFERSHFRISSTDSKVKTQKHNSRGPLFLEIPNNLLGLKTILCTQYPSAETWFLLILKANFKHL